MISKVEESWGSECVLGADLAILGHAEACCGGKVAALHDTALHEDVRELLVDDLLPTTPRHPLHPRKQINDWKVPCNVPWNADANEEWR